MSDFLQRYGLQSASFLSPWDSPNKNAGQGCHALLQIIFPTHNFTHMSHISCIGRWVLYHQSLMGSPQSGCTNTQLHWQSTGALFSSHAFQHLLSLVFFNDGHTNRHVVTSLWGFDLHFPDVSDVDHLFKYLLAICMYSLSKKVYSGLLSTLIELFVFCSMLYEFMGYMSF